MFQVDRTLKCIGCGTRILTKDLWDICRRCRVAICKLPDSAFREPPKKEKKPR